MNLEIIELSDGTILVPESVCLQMTKEDGRISDLSFNYVCGYRGRFLILNKEVHDPMLTEFLPGVMISETGQKMVVFPKRN